MYNVGIQTQHVDKYVVDNPGINVYGDILILKSYRVQHLTYFSDISTLKFSLPKFFILNTIH